MKKLRALFGKQNNRGASLITVLIAMSIMTIFGVMVLSLAYTNFSMKMIDRRAKDNFYSAEEVLDRIKVGLAQQIDDDLSEAYVGVMENYAGKKPSELISTFDNAFMISVITKLQLAATEVRDDPLDPAAITDQYYLLRLDNFLNICKIPYTIDEEGKIIITASNGSTIDIYGGETDGNFIVRIKDARSGRVGALKIFDLTVEYTDKMGYTSIISTDINISTPGLVFTTGNVLDYGTYSIIAQGGMDVVSNNLIFGGSVYSGEKVQINGNVNMENTKIFVSDGEVVLDGGTFSTGTQSTVWAKDITLSADNSNSSTISMLGRTYLANDLKINAPGSKVTLAGEFCGFGSDRTTSGTSSAIIINGRNTDMDISGLKKLTVAGTAFVDAQNEKSAANLASASVSMGDSVAVKINQLAYLVPSGCAGVISNPMTYDTFEATVRSFSETSDFSVFENAIVNSRIESLGGKTLKDYDNPDNPGLKIVPVYSNHGDGFVYLFINYADSKCAGAYFEDFYANAQNKETLDSFLNLYIGGNTPDYDYAKMALSGDTVISMGGNYLVTTSHMEGDSSVIDGLEIELNDETFGSMQNYVERYRKYSQELTMSAVVDSIILDYFIEKCDTAKTNGTLPATVSVLTSKSDTNTEFNVYVVRDNSGEVAVTIIDNEGKGAAVAERNEGGMWTLTAGATAVEFPAKGLIISTGDLTVRDAGAFSYDGLVIVGGCFRTFGNVTLNADKEAFARAIDLKETIDGNEYLMSGLFVNGGDLLVDLNGVLDDAEVTAASMITFENWTKK